MLMILAAFRWIAHNFGFADVEPMSPHDVTAFEVL